MTIKLISYDLGMPETSQTYKNLINDIKNLGQYWAKPLKSFWLVDNGLSCHEILNRLSKHLDANDKIIVIRLPLSEWSSQGLPKSILDWMHKH